MNSPPSRPPCVTIPRNASSSPRLNCARWRCMIAFGRRLSKVAAALAALPNGSVSPGSPAPSPRWPLGSSSAFSARRLSGPSHRPRRPLRGCFRSSTAHSMKTVWSAVSPTNWAFGAAMRPRSAMANCASSPPAVIRAIPKVAQSPAISSNSSICARCGTL